MWNLVAARTALVGLHLTRCGALQFRVMVMDDTYTVETYQALWLNLLLANTLEKAEWSRLYLFAEAYGLPNANATSLRMLLSDLDDNTVFAGATPSLHSPLRSLCPLTLSLTLLSFLRAEWYRRRGVESTKEVRPSIHWLG